ncbi:MAG: GYF domain-containing protein [Gemmataceae bacterium]|nr:GYF domain-containing protein [Gemmataceae bacterium]
MLRFTCPRCKMVMSRSDDEVGHKISCPGCGQRVPIPLPPTDQTLLEGNVPFQAGGQPTTSTAPDWLADVQRSEQSAAQPSAGPKPAVPSWIDDVRRVEQPYARVEPSQILPQIPTAQPVPPPGSAQSAGWFCTHEGRRYGPFSWAQLKALAASGRLTGTDLVWQNGMDRWLPAGTIRELFPPVSSPPPSRALPPVPAVDASPPPSTAEEALTPEQVQKLADVRRACDEMEVIAEQWKAMQQGAASSDAAGALQPADRHPLQYLIPDLAMKTLSIQSRRAGIIVLLALVLASITFLTAASKCSWWKQSTVLDGCLVAISLTLFGLILFFAWALVTCCSACNRLWACILQKETHLGTTQGFKTVARTDVHKDDDGRRWGTTERKEQVHVTRQHVRCHWICRFCDHQWTTKKVLESEG